MMEVHSSARSAGGGGLRVCELAAACRHVRRRCFVCGDRGNHLLLQLVGLRLRPLQCLTGGSHGPESTAEGHFEWLCVRELCPGFDELGVDGCQGLRAIGIGSERRAGLEK